jgi:hypothetical protein
MQVTRKSAWQEKQQGSQDGGRNARGADEPKVVLVTKEDEGWVVEIEEDSHRETYRTKAEAVQDARELARKIQPSELIIEKVDGRRRGSRSIRDSTVVSKRLA